jgi:PAS domain S-box-containing protein
MSSPDVERGTSQEVEELRRQVAELRHKLAEEALKDSESRLALIFNGVSDLLFLIGVEAGPRFRCLAVNCSYLKWTGWTREEMVGKLVEEILSPEQAQCVIKKYTAAMQSRSPTTYEESADIPAGRLVVETTLTPVFDAQGHCTHLLGASRDITERKLMVKALRQSEARYRTVSELVSNYAYAVRLEPAGRGTLEWITEAFSRITGFTVQDLAAGIGLECIIHPEDMPRVQQRLRVLFSGQPGVSEHRIVTKSGEVRWLRDYSTPEWDTAQGRIVRIIGAGQDITERKQAEEALQESEERYRKLFENANDALATFSLDGTITAVNRAAERLLGWSREELIGQHVRKVATPASVTLAEERAQRFLVGERPPSSVFEAELIRKDGSVVTVETHTRAIRNAAGKPVGFQGIYRDMTERRRIEIALRESEQRYRAVVETQTELVCRFLPDTTLTFVNEAYCRYFGKSREELLGTSFLFLIPEPARPAAKAHIASLIVHPRLVVDEHEVIAAGGSIRWQQWTDQAIVDDTGRLTEFQSTGLDITERKRAEEALRQLQGELAHVSRVTTMGAMAASIAHEVNQPLGAIVGNADICLRWLARATPDLVQVRDALCDIIMDGHRASAVIARIRALVKKEAPQETRCNLNVVIREAITLASHELRRKRVVLRTEIVPDLPLVYGDRIQLEQVILNLIMNGIEAMSEVTGRTRELIIRSDRNDGNGVLVTVQDCGVGIDPQETKHIFAPFYTTKPEGMGMGLAICRSIVEAHGGRLWAVPNAGPGVTFQFSLPAGYEER